MVRQPFIDRVGETEPILIPISCCGVKHCDKGPERNATKDLRGMRKGRETKQGPKKGKAPKAQ